MRDKVKYRMKNRGEIPPYYRKVYEKWYRWFAYIYDPFVRVFLFLINGGFRGEGRFRELTVDWVNPQPGEKILDICAGTGTLAIMLAKIQQGAGKVAGIELSPAQLRIANKKEKPTELSFINGDAQNIPFSNDYFDKSVISCALHELPQQVRKNVLMEAYRVMKAGGIIVIVEPNKPVRKWKVWLFDFMERFNPEYPTYKNLLNCGLTNEIRRAGFRIDRTDIVCWEYFQIVLAVKQIW